MPLITSTGKPRVILGLMTFGPDKDAGARITDVEGFGKILDLFQGRGYNEVDTARMYVAGRQEAFTRDVGWQQRGLTLATKVGYPKQHGQNSAALVKESVETSLRELGADSVDLLYLHAPDRGTPFAETLSAINDLHKAGRFSRLGLSNFSAYEVAEIVMTCRANGWVRPTVFQAMYNLLTRSIEAELIPACRRYGLDIVVYNPIGAGLLTGKIKSSDLDVEPEEGTRFSDKGGFGQMYRSRYYRRSTFDALARLEDITARAGLPMLEIALRWTLHHSALRITNGNDGIILGTSSIEQLQHNLGLVEKGPLPADVAEEVNQIWQITKADTANYWHMDLEYGYDTREALK